MYGIIRLSRDDICGSADIINKLILAFPLKTMKKVHHHKLTYSAGNYYYIPMVFSNFPLANTAG